MGVTRSSYAEKNARRHTPDARRARRAARAAERGKDTSEAAWRLYRRYVREAPTTTRGNRR